MWRVDSAHVGRLAPNLRMNLSGCLSSTPWAVDKEKPLGLQVGRLPHKRVGGRRPSGRG